MKYIISHSLFLNKTQRRRLQKKKGVVKLIGVQVPIKFEDGKTDEPAKEVFAPYRVVHGDGDAEPIKLVKGVYTITLHKASHCQKLLRFEEGGVDGFSFIHSNHIDIGNGFIPVMHQVRISTSESLEDSMYCNHLDHIDSK